jgi:arsenate reductase
MEKVKVLFVCVHNSARSQIAETFVNNLAGDMFTAESAGIEPGTLNPFVVKVMEEIGIDISANKTKDVFEFIKAGKFFNYVITVCEREAAEKCPIFPGVTKRIEWSFKDPSKLIGDEETIISETRIIRDEIKQKIVSWLAEVKQS